MLLTSFASRVFIASLCVLSISASAHKVLTVAPPPPTSDTTDSTGAYANLQMRDRDSGAVLPIYRHNGKLYVAGTPGRRYGISLRNQLDTRGLLVVSVDGVNALTGETADYSQAGYVLQSGQAYEVKGWRKSTREVAAFTFTALPDSYAARTGRPQDVGAIGIAVFREAYIRPAAAPVPYMDEQRAETRSAPSAAGQAQDSAARLSKRAEKLGTGHGEREASVVERTSFERAHSVPDEVITIYYDSRANLIAQGVIREPGFGSLPRPFPAQPMADTRNFVPDPHLR